ARGDRQAFWSSRASRGDPLGATGLNIVNDFGMGSFANGLLEGAIEQREGRAGRRIGYAAVASEVQSIGVQLMRAHVDLLVRTNGRINAADIADYHFDVFRQNGLPASTFGGSLIGGSTFEARVTKHLWMDC